ncbi:hypothetical protein [Rhizobium sp. YTU87027]|uniref:hypothetical protein n=1 Tax=Rhizobium sp. YTU87027 TaxID=3417741 RepID=UPI003D6951BB
MSVEALNAPQIDSAAVVDTGNSAAPETINEDADLGAVFDRMERDNGAARENGRFASPDPTKAKVAANNEPLEGGGGEDTDAVDPSTPSADVPLPSSWRGKEALWEKIPADVRADLRAHQEELHKTLSTQGQALSAYKPLSDVLMSYKEYFGGEMGNYKPHEAVEYLFNLQRQMDKDPINTLLQIADTYELRGELQKMFGAGAPAGEGGAQSNEAALLAKISQLEGTIRQMGDPSRIDERISQRLNEEKQFGEVDSLVSRISKDMPLYNEIPEPDLVSFIHMAKQKLGGAASQEAVLKRAYDMAINADPDLRAKAAALKAAAANDPNQVAAAKRANETNLRSTSTGKARQLTQEEELGAVYDKMKG